MCASMCSQWSRDTVTHEADRRGRNSKPALQTHPAAHCKPRPAKREGGQLLRGKSTSHSKESSEVQGEYSSYGNTPPGGDNTSVITVEQKWILVPGYFIQTHRERRGKETTKGED